MMGKKLACRAGPGNAGLDGIHLSVVRLAHGKWVGRRQLFKLSGPTAHARLCPPICAGGLDANPA